MTVPVHDMLPRYGLPEVVSESDRDIERPRQPEIIHTQDYDEFIEATSRVAGANAFSLSTIKIVGPEQAEGKPVFVELGPLSLVCDTTRFDIERTDDMVDMFLEVKESLDQIPRALRIPEDISRKMKAALGEIISSRDLRFDQRGCVVGAWELPEELRELTLEDVKRDSDFSIIKEQKSIKSRAPSLTARDQEKQSSSLETVVTVVKRGGIIRDKNFDRLLLDITKGFDAIEQMIQRYLSDEDYRNKQDQRFGVLSDGSIDNLRHAMSLVAGLVPTKHEVVDKYMLVDKRINRHEMESGTDVRIGIDYRLLTREERAKLPEALRDLPDLTIEKGSLCTIVGTNGSGKSTLARAIQNAMLYMEGSGHSHTSIGVNIEDIEGGKQNTASFNLARCIDVSGIGSVQSDNPPCIYLDCAKGVMNYIMKSSQGGSVVESLMAEQKVYTVSTGEAQEMYFAEASSHYDLQSYTGLLIIDEPEKGLDPWKLRGMKARLRDMAPKATIVVITHNPMMVFDSSIERVDLRFPERGVHVDKEESIFLS